MKKSILLAIMAIGTTGAFAQDLTSKKGEPFLPEAGDWSIGIDAVPFLEYAGNFFGKSTTNAAPSFNFLTTNQTITGRYFMDAKSAVRANLRIGFGGEKQRTMVDDRSVVPSAASYPSADPMVENSWKHSTTNIGLAVGYEMRRGKTRLQGYYGGEVGVYLSNSKDKFEYGNALNPAPTGTNPAVVPTSADSFTSAGNFTGGSVTSGQTSGARVTERKNGSTFSVGLRGFIGVEYFLFPKISLGGEFGWGFGLTSMGKTSTTWESTGNTGGGGNDVVGSTTIEGAKQSGFRLDTDNANSIWGATGALRLNFYF